MEEAIFIIIDNRGIFVAAYATYEAARDHLRNSDIERKSGSTIFEMRLDKSQDQYFVYP